MLIQQPSTRRGNAARDCSRVWVLAATLVLAGVLQAALLAPAAAQTSVWEGDINNSWFVSDNWVNGVPTVNALIATTALNTTFISGAPASITGTLSIGNAGGGGDLTINNGGSFTRTASPVEIFLGSSGGPVSFLAVDGPGSQITSTGLGFIRVGEVGPSAGTPGNGALFVSGGASISGVQIYIADAVGSLGDVEVSGAGSSIFVPATGGNTGWVSVGFAGEGSLLIEDGGTVTSQVGALATTATGDATVVVEHAGSLWTIYGGTEFHVGGRGVGELTIRDRGQVNAMTSPITIGGTAAGANAGQGTVIVEGEGSLTNTGNTTVGINGGTGTLTVRNNGSVTTSTLFIAEGAGSTGTLNIGTGGTPGTVDASSIQFGAGTGTINFNHNSTGYFFGVPISGPGFVHAIAGTTIFTANDTYTGGTTIDSGATLQLGNGGATGGIVGNVTDNGNLIFNRSNTYTFGDVISGTGAVFQNGSGTTNLTNTNTYIGPTAVNAGRLLINGSIVSFTTVNAGGTLGGNGTIFNGVDNFGIVAPGNSIGALTITGPYVGFGGTLQIESILASDNSPTDQLILSGAGASASGSTFVQVINLNGPGALTTGFGIPIVVAQGGAVTTASAFSLAGPAAAGPFQYLLFRGPESGGTADQQNTWYLRSHTTVGGAAVPLYRPETSMYAALPGEARALGLMTLGTFHERNGDQGLVRGEGQSERAWGRIFGGHIEQDSPGTVDASFSGYAAGIQLGIDALHFRGSGSEEDVAGLFFAVPQTRGDINGFAIGVVDAYAGNSQLTGPGYGAYYTHIGPGNWYLDAIAMASFYDAIGTSTNNVAIDVDATGLIASLEGGLPLALGGGVTLEPQGQLVYQYLDFDQASDIFSSVDIDAADVLTGRVGLRLAGVFGIGADLWHPYLKANLWHDWGGTDRAIYAGVHALDSKFEMTALEAGGGVVAQLTDGVGLWGDAAYTTDIEGDELEIIQGNAGVKVSW